MRWLVVLVPLCVLGGVIWWYASGDPPAVDPPEVQLSADQRLRDALRRKAVHEVTAVLPELLDNAGSIERSQWVAAAEACVGVGHLTLADRCLERASAGAARSVPFELQRLQILYSAGRTDEARAGWTDLMRKGGIDLLSLPMLGNADLLLGQHVTGLDAAPEPARGDVLGTEARARLALNRGDVDRARTLLAPSMSGSASPNAHGMWLGVLREAKDDDALYDWLERLPAEARDSPDVLVIAGDVALRLDRRDEAVRCYAAACRRDPNLHAAVNQLGQLLVADDRPEQGRVLMERAERLREYAGLCLRIHTADALPADVTLRKAARLAESLECVRDAIAWSQVAAALDPRSRWPAREVARLRERVSPRDGRLPHDFDGVAGLDVAGDPWPDWSNVPRTENPSRSGGAVIRFEDDAKRLGITAAFDDGGDATAERTRLFEFTGGGVAVLDYDRDDWPDLYFTQGGPPPALGHPDPTAVANIERPRDAFYRNVGGQAFVEIGIVAGLIVDDYGQGCSVGDIDGDGFADLYVANIGRNRLFLNNGDGTFDEVHPETFGEHWTTSCAIADLNGDGLADIYDVNHIVATGVHTEMCRVGDASRPCDSSKRLEAEQDRLLLNRGDGTFDDVTEAAGIVADDGLGLGLVIGDLDGVPGLDVFVVNDARANFLFIGEGGRRDVPRFTELAQPFGVAFNRDGRAQACMGIAVDDADADGRLDLFVTNFFADYNTLYLQRDGLFTDDSARARLAAASRQTLGFGTQFLDADLNGQPDLVVTNGDVVDFSRTNGDRPYAQPPQCFLNVGNGRFEQLLASTGGPLFDEGRVGRGLARVDWNRDGREDFVVSHIKSLAVLATNRTERTGRSLIVELIGTTSERIPIGTRVTVHAGGTSQTRQLTAGDGYMAANDRHLVFGLANLGGIDKVEIGWPSGVEQRHTDVEANSGVIAIEGLPLLPRLPR